MSPVDFARLAVTADHVAGLAYVAALRELADAHEEMASANTASMNQDLDAIEHGAPAGYGIAASRAHHRIFVARRRLGEAATLATEAEEARMLAIGSLPERA